MPGFRFSFGALLIALPVIVLAASDGRFASRAADIAPATQTKQAGQECICVPLPAVADSKNPRQGKNSAEIDYALLRGIVGNRDTLYGGNWDAANLAMAHEFDPGGKLGIWTKPKPPEPQKSPVAFVEGGTPWRILHNGLSAIVRQAQAGKNGLPGGRAWPGRDLEWGLLTNIARANKYGEVEGDMQFNSVRLSWFLTADLARAEVPLRAEQQKRMGLSNPAPAPAPKPAPSHVPQAAPARPAPRQAANTVITPLMPMPVNPALTVHMPAISMPKYVPPPKPGKPGDVDINGIVTSRVLEVAAVGMGARGAITNALEAVPELYDHPNTHHVTTVDAKTLPLDSYDYANAALDVIEESWQEAGQNDYFDYRWTEDWKSLDDTGNKTDSFDNELVPDLVRLAAMRKAFGGHAAANSPADDIACKAFHILTEMGTQSRADGSHYRMLVGLALAHNSGIVSDNDWKGTRPEAQAARAALMVTGVANRDEAHRVIERLWSNSHRLAEFIGSHSKSTTDLAQLEAIYATIADLAAYSTGGAADFGADMHERIQQDQIWYANESSRWYHGEIELKTEIDAWGRTKPDSNPGVTLTAQPASGGTSVASGNGSTPPQIPKNSLQPACPFGTCSAAMLDGEKPNYPNVTFPTHAWITMTAQDGSSFIARDQPIKINVTMPKDMATTANPFITVTDTTTGGNVNVPLSFAGSTAETVSYTTEVRGAPQGQKPLKTTARTVSLADAGANGFFTRTLKSKDGDPITASMAGAAAEATVYDSEDQATLARTKDNLQSTLKAFDLMADDTSRPAAERAHGGWLERKRAAIHNALIILNQKNGALTGDNYSLNDTMKARVGEIYVQLIGGDAANWDTGDHAQCGNPNSAEARRAHMGIDGRFPGVNFETCPEAMDVNAAVYSVGQKQQEAAFRSLADITIAFYHTYVVAGCTIQMLNSPVTPCANQFWMLFTGTDEDGKEADTTTKVVNAASMALPFVLNGGNASLRQEIEAFANSETTMVEDAARKGAVAESATEKQAEKETQSALSKASQEAHEPVPSLAEIETADRETRRSAEILADHRAQLSHLDGAVSNTAVSVPANLEPVIEGAQQFIPKAGMKLPAGVNASGEYIKQIGDNACQITVWEYVRRMLGKVARTEEQNTWLALGRGRVERMMTGKKNFFIYDTERGSVAKFVDYFMQPEGILARYVPDLNLVDIRDALKRGWAVSVSVNVGLDANGVDKFHAIQIFGLYKDAKGVPQVLYGDPGNGKYWVADACELIEAMKATANGERETRGVFYKLP